MPALSNCTFSGSPGQAVSKHHKSLQQTYGRTQTFLRFQPSHHERLSLDYSTLFDTRLVHSKYTFWCSPLQRNDQHVHVEHSRRGILDRAVPTHWFLSRENDSCIISSDPRCLFYLD